MIPCYAINTPTYPLLAYINDDNYKLFLNDTGILTSLTNIDKSEMLLENDYPFKGVIAENYVANELVKQGFKLYYWSNKNNSNNIGKSEVDFVIQSNGKIIPIEVKAGTDMRTKSLIFIQKNLNLK